MATLPFSASAGDLFADTTRAREPARTTPRIARRRVAFLRAEDITVELVKSAQSGDRDAFQTIVRALERLVYQTVNRLIGSRYAAEVDDVTQEIMIKLHRNLDRFDPDRGTRFHSWVLAMVRNHCFDVLKRRRPPVVSWTVLTDEDNEVDLPASGGGPQEDLSNKEIRGRIASEVRALPKQQRNAFVLREYQGLSYQQIAKTCDCSEGTVKSRIHRAKETLRRRLAPLFRSWGL